MSTFIANAIEKQARVSIDKGKDKYKAYFVKTKMYEAYRADVDIILETDGFGEVITER